MNLLKHSAGIRKTLTRSTVFALLLALSTFAFAQDRSEPASKIVKQDDEKKKPKGQPDQITVQHILIAFEGSIPGKEIKRSKEEAEKLAKELFEAARKKDADFDALVKKHTDDSHPGIYSMVNFGLEGDPRNPDPKKRVYQRKTMVAAFGDTGFPLKVGEVGLAVYDKAKSKYGWHIVKRIK